MGGKCGWSSRNSAVAIVAAVAFAFAFSVRAQQPETKPAPKPEEAAQPAEQSLLFEVIRFQVEGTTLMKPETVQRLLAPFTGKQKDFSDIQRALETLEVAFRNLGYGSVQIVLPEQNIASGVVRFDVVEPRIGRIFVEGAERYDVTSVRRSIPALREGQIPNSVMIARNLALANENPARQTQVLMRNTETDGVIDASIKVTEDKPWKASMSVDNTGTTSTGDYRVSTGFQHANVFNRDHLLTLQYITSPNHIPDVKVYGIGYKIPLYSLGSSLEFVGGYSNVNTGSLGGLFTVSGSGTIAGARLNQYFNKLGDYEHKLVYSIDYKAFQSQVITANGTSLVPDITVHPIGLTYQGTLRGERSETSFYGGVSQNVFPGDNDGADSDFKASRAEAKASYRVYRAGLSHTRATETDWQLRLQLSGQYTEHALITGEQFGVGGADNVRGFLEREVANDRGYRGSVEVYTPNLGAKINLPNTQTRVLAFYDFGDVTRVSPQPSEQLGQSLASVGAGLRLAGSKYWSTRFDYARVIDAAGSQNKGHTRLHLNISLSY